MTSTWNLFAPFSSKRILVGFFLILAVVSAYMTVKIWTDMGELNPFTLLAVVFYLMCAIAATNYSNQDADRGSLGGWVLAVTAIPITAAFVADVSDRLSFGMYLFCLTGTISGGLFIVTQSDEGAVTETIANLRRRRLYIPYMIIGLPGKSETHSESKSINKQTWKRILTDNVSISNKTEAVSGSVNGEPFCLWGVDKNYIVYAPANLLPEDELIYFSSGRYQFQSEICLAVPKRMLKQPVWIMPMILMP